MIFIIASVEAFGYVQSEYAMIAKKVTTVGFSVGVVLPNEALAKLNVAKDDTLYLTDAPYGSMRVTPQGPEFARRACIIEDIMRDDRDILAALTK